MPPVEGESGSLAFFSQGKISKSCSLSEWLQETSQMMATIDKIVESNQKQLLAKKHIQYPVMFVLRNQITNHLRWSTLNKGDLMSACCGQNLVPTKLWDDGHVNLMLKGCPVIISVNDLFLLVSVTSDVKRSILLRLRPPISSKTEQGRLNNSEKAWHSHSKTAYAYVDVCLISK